jgi:hypothetical protein
MIQPAKLNRQISAVSAMTDVMCHLLHNDSGFDREVFATDALVPVLHT